MADEQQAPPVSKRIEQWINQRPGTTVLTSLLFVTFFILFYWATLGNGAPQWTGFGAYDEVDGGPRARTLWDWLGLLSVPAALGAGAYWLNKSQKDTELKIAEKAREKDRELAEKARASEREIADSRQKQASLEAYYDRMTELLLEHGLRESAAESEMRSIARARTIAVVKSLDAERNRQLFAFLQASKLTEGKPPVVNLARADLSGSDLSNIAVIGADISQIKLISATLSGALLRKVDLRMADLSQANLSHIDLNEVDLFQAILKETVISDALLYEVNLRGANLIGANISKTKFIQVNLSYANLGGADLSKTDLSNADLSMANLSGAILDSSSLSETCLVGANLSVARLLDSRHWTIEQFDQVRSLEYTMMPDGIRLAGAGFAGPTYDEWKVQYLAKQGESGMRV